MRFSKRIRDDSGAHTTIEFIILILVFFAILMTVLDIGMFFNNRSIIYNAAGNGARLVAVFGGTDPNRISTQYSVVGMTSNCNSSAINSEVACSVYEELLQSNTSVNSSITNISCGPNRTAGIGDRTFCEVTYKYHGLPGSGLSVVRLFGKDYRVRVTSESEVVNR